MLSNRAKSRRAAPVSSPPRICLALLSGNSYCRGILTGLAEYVQRHDPWSIVTLNRRLCPSVLRRIEPVDGFISLQVDDKTMAGLHRRGVPVVFVESGRDNQPHVVPDEEALGRMAVEHFLELGLNRVAFFSGERTAFGEQRRKSFLQHARDANLEIRDNLAEQPNSFLRPSQRRRWLASLPEQVGLFLVTSGWSRPVLNWLADLGRPVPDDIAVLTAEFSELDARLCRPTLSSVDQATERIGYKAGELLSALMAGQPPSETRIRVFPLRIYRRSSTDTLAVEDSEVRAAVRFIRKRAVDGIGVEDVLRHVVISRRGLEQRFRQHLGRTIHKEILRVRLTEAKRLLAETSLALPDIAVRVGYEHASNLCKVFRRELGLRPSEFRR